MKQRKVRARSAIALVAFSMMMAVAFALPSLRSTAATPEETIWGSESPDAQVAGDTAAVELGTSFTVEREGNITGIRYWRESSSYSARAESGTLWSSDGTRIATAEFASPRATGWQSVTFSSPVEVDAGDSFVASYRAPSGQYSYSKYFRGTSESDSLSIPATNAGRFSYSSSTRFPSRTYQSTNYWVSPVFRASASGSPTATSSPTATRAPSPTTSPTATSSPSATRSPSSTSSPTATRSPTATSSPTATRSPTATSSPSATSGSDATPGPDNTGVPAGTSLTSSGGLRVTKANTVLSNLDIFGQVSIEAPGVVIRNCKIHGSGSGNAIQVRSGSVEIFDSEIYGYENGIGGDNWEATRVDIHSTTGDGIKLGSNTLVEDSWIHDLSPDSDAHADGIQVQSGIDNASVLNNVIDLSRTASANAALFIAPDLGPSSDGPLLVQGNYLDGGNYTVQVLDGDYGKYYIAQIAFRDNTWGHKSNYGPVRTNVAVAWVNNTFADTGVLIKP